MCYAQGIDISGLGLSDGAEEESIKFHNSMMGVDRVGSGDRE